MGVIFTSVDSERVIARKKHLKEWLFDVVKREKLKVGEITIILCSDSYMVEANAQFLSHNYPTDIITFDYCQGKIVSGDLLISADTVKRNAEQWSVTFEREMQRVIVHGVLHLCGYGDKSEQEKVVMRGKENFYLRKFYAI